jgi:uncharacterized lipoprotein YddW (UPF0748 family)
MRLILLFVLLCLLYTFSYGQNNSEWRKAFWVVRDAINTQSEIDKIIRTAITFDINDIFVQVRALGNTYYSSDLEMRSELVKTNFDPLSDFIEKADYYNIRVHAWVNMFYIWSGEKIPPQKDHIYHLLQKNILRNCSFPSYAELRSDGIEGYYLDPQSEQVQKYLLNLLQEIADKYNVAGIHLDYFRYPGVLYSFTPESRTNFKLEHFYDPLPIYCTTNEFVQGRGHAVYRHADRVYRHALSNSLSAYLKRISEELHAIKQNIELSVSVKPDPVEAKHRYFQDWISWISSELCEFVVIMNYRTDWKEFISIIDQIKNQSISKKVMIGVSTYNQDARAAMRRLEVIKNLNFAGSSLFSYNYLIKNEAYFKAMRLYYMSGGINGS